MAKTTPERALELVRKAGVLRPRDLDEHGIPRVYLRRLLEEGRIERVGRGLYSLPEGDVTEHRTIIEAAKRVPQGVVCLLSALRFHELTTQNPFEVWMAIANKAWQPRAERPTIRIVRMSGEALESGIEEHRLEGVRVRVYGPAKTVADCFKFRNKIGLDIAIEALRDYRRTRPQGLDELWRFARICRVSNVMRPYLEAIA